MKTRAGRLGTALGLAALLALAAVAGWRTWRGPEVQTLAVVQRDFMQTVVASGRVETPHRISVGSQVTGTVRRVLVEEGQAVAAGAPLVELEDSELQATLQQAELAVQAAAARLRQLREVQAPVAEQALRQAQANHDAALQVLQRQRELVARGFIGQAAVDEAERAEQVAGAQLRSAQQQLRSAGPGGSDLALAQATLAQARAAADAARARLRYARLQAPVAAQVIARSVEPGDVVQPGRVLLLLSPTGPGGSGGGRGAGTELVLQIDEKNLRLLQLGQRAVAVADAYPQRRLQAELVFIHPGVDPQRGSVEVRLRVAEPPPELRQDMTVSVDIEVARRAHAVLLPAAALREADPGGSPVNGSAEPWVLKIDGRHARRQPLTVGLRSGGWVEVLAGLQAGDLVIAPGAPGAALLKDGARVRAVVP